MDLPLVDGDVTIEALLTHTSGIGDHLDEDGGWDVSDFVLTLPVHTLTSAGAFLPMLHGHPQKSVPGERFSYCNGGLMVLAVQLERATGSTYHDVVRRPVFEPGGLERTGFLPLNDQRPDAALGYVHNEGDLVNTLHLPALGNGDGGAFTTADDVHRFWLTLLDAGASFRSTHVVSTRTTVSVLGNSSEGAWPVISALAATIDAALG